MLNSSAMGKGIQRASGILLFLIAAALYIVAIGVVLHLVNAVRTWPSTRCIVSEIRLDPTYGKKLGVVELKIQYQTIFGQRSTWIRRTVFALHRKRFMTDYAVGSSHRIWLNPDVSSPDVELGWSVETVFSTLVCLAFATVLIRVGHGIMRLP